MSTFTMSFRDNIKQRAEKSNENYLKKNKAREYHSRPYHRFFEGYAEQYVFDEKGESHIERVYVGDYYCPEGTAKEHLTDKLLGAALYLAAVALYVVCAVQRVWYNAFVPVELFEVIGLVVLFWFLFPVFAHLKAGQKLMIRQYRDAADLYRLGSCAAAFCMWALALSVLISVAAVREEIIFGLLLAAGFALSGLCLYLIYLKEKKRIYKKVPAKNVKKRESYTIDY
ncbi:MAG: hypothetical protein LUH19_07275 [Lachnospiraceae bacterium]|nr:hypothetical protein [Lachnospiraceae bacterium]